MRAGKRLTFAFALTTSLSALVGHAFAADKIPTPADALLRNHTTGALELSGMHFEQSALRLAHLEQAGKVSIYYRTLASAVDQECGSVEYCAKKSPFVAHTLALYDSYVESEALEAWDKARSETFHAKLADDPFLMDAQARWDIPKGHPGHLNVYSRLKILRHIMDIHGDVYAADGFPVKGLNLSAKNIPREDRHAHAIAYYEALTVFTNHKHLMKNSFADWVKLITHECRHGIQFSMIHALNDKDGLAYLGSHKLIPAAIIYRSVLDHLSWNKYGAKQYYSHYRHSPLERDAYNRLDGAKALLTPKPLVN